MFELLANRDTAELIYFWSGTLLPIITIGAIFFTAIQVNYAKKQLQITAQQAQATLLLDLVEKWNSRNMHESRVAFDQIELEAKTKVYSQYNHLSDREVTNKLK